MPKARNKQQNRKKRDKRRLLQQAAASPKAWESLDLSAWFDTSVGFEQGVDGAVSLNDDSGQFIIYPYWLPGEKFFSYWAHEHPDNEAETAAVCLIKQIMAHDKPGLTESDLSQGKAIIKKLIKMAKDGCITASSYLGYVYLQGRYVRRDLKKTAHYLKVSFDKKEPVACLWIAIIANQQNIEGPDIEKALDVSCEAGCSQALHLKAFQVCNSEREVTGSELDSLACRMVASASKGSWRCLDGLMDLLGTTEESDLKKKYGFAILSLLEKFAAADYAPAVSRLADAYLLGILGPKNVEKGKHLLLRARTLGDDLAGVKYADCLLATAKTDISDEERKQLTRAIIEILEEDRRNGKGFPKADETLGMMLVASEDDESFARGISILENCISHGVLTAAKAAAITVPALTGKKERIKSIIKLLNSLVRKKDVFAMFRRARYYLQGEFAKRRDREKGLRLMHQAADQDYTDACFFLAQTYLFGLFGCAPDMQKAQDMAQKGMELGHINCGIFNGLIAIGEFSDRAKKLTDKEIATAVDQIIREFDSSEPYQCTLYNLSRTKASKALGMADLDDMCEEGPFKEEVSIFYARELADICLDMMHACNLGCLSFMAHALKKIAKTQYAKQYAAAFAETLSLGQETDCKGIADYLQNFIDSMPEGYNKFSPGYFQYLCDKEA